MKKKLLTLMVALLGLGGVNAQVISWNEKVDAGKLEETYSNGDFVLTRVDTGSKNSIASKESTFTDEASYTYYLATGGKTSSGTNYIVLTIPSAGTLKVYARSGSSSAKDRNIVITQTKELYNEVVKDEDAVENKYPVISVTVTAGTVNVTYPTGALYIFAFEFIANEGDGGNQGGESEEPGEGDEPGNENNIAELEEFFSAKVIAAETKQFGNGTTEIISDLATITGGKMFAVNSRTKDENFIKDDNKVYYFNVTQNDTYFKIELDKALSVGDVISATIVAEVLNDTKSGERGILITSTENRSTSSPSIIVPQQDEKKAPITNTYTVREDDGLANASTIYIYRYTGNSTYFGDFTISHPVVSVTVSDAGYCTYASEYALDFTNSDVEAYKAIDNGDNVSFEQVTGTVPAKTGLLIKAEANEYKIPVASGDVDNVTSALVGVFEDGGTAKSDDFILYEKGGVVGFYKVGSANIELKKNTAYFPASSVTTAARISYIAVPGGGNDGTTGLKAIENKVTEDGKVYDLQGRQVTNPAKGLYIKNGKKYIVK